ncbi:TadE/TadG family type IV pilus assembly protein [Massilia sp. S19_KUP03_FR1]|uniref:TadE/TadG family type IV pilus assembly protein n=1 Tax=Massilia sp. S19_KUP03_FR1 TaxID=3025503 RepID=UPI002FCD1A96
MMRAPERGQAMVEMAVILGVIVMLFLGIIYLGKFHDIQASTIQAARYSAWERTVHSAGAMNDTQIQNQVRARFYTWNTDALKSTDGLVNGADWTTQSAVWRDHSTRSASVEEARLIARPDDVGVTTSTGPLAGLATKTIAEGLGVISGMLDAITGGEPLPQGATVTGKVVVKLNNIAALPAPLDALNLTLRESSSVITEQWDASGPRQAALRARTFTVAGPITQINGFLEPIEKAISIFEPSFKNLHFGQVCPDIVPSDRVESAAVLPVYRGGGACVR